MSGEVRVSANGWTVGIGDRQMWLQGPETSTVMVYWRGELSQSEQRDMLHSLIPVLCMVKKALEP